MFKRKIYEKLLDWKETSQGSTALLIEGARRIGKSTVVEEFAKKEYESYILIDFAFASSEVKALFEDMSDINYFFLQLQLRYKVDLHERDSVIIFDEVQFCPLARQAIKVLVKDGRYDYIETGSLISIKKNVQNILIPSEERRISMFPMDYEEFLWALGDNTTVPVLKKAYEGNMRLGDDMNRKLMRDFRLYMLVGGMPQAVSAYINTNNLKKVDEVKRDILKLYDDDLKKIDPTGRASMFFSAIPAQLAKNVSRYQVSGVLENRRAGEVLELVAEMSNSKTVLIAYQSTDPSVDLAAAKDLSVFKMFLADTGLFVTLMFMNKDFTENVIYEKLLSDKLPSNLGYLYENAVAQALAASGNELFYHSWCDRDREKYYEIDFLLARNNKLCPIEVKSSGYKTHSSLDAFCSKYSDRVKDRYLVYTKDLLKDKETVLLPVYLAQFL